ncbi:MAG: hypothetical protein GY913_00105 [Proteobacteria bacterium]|nr:hypothetical protein [Pseudomonadota bacterium]MCP4915299.1 hypothetical protein [Pseudomonadota bacterium]
MLVLFIGCGAFDAGADPAIEAHRGAAGNWPQNSRLAMTESVAAGYDGLEFDLLLTSDGHAVLSHDPWIHEELCTHADGSAVTEELLISEMTLEEIQDGFLCGGVLDPEAPDAELFAESPMSWDELLDVIEDDPDMLIHIDVKYEPDGTTRPADEFADVIWTAWDARDLPNPYYVSANTADALKAFKALDQDIPTSLIWPRFPPGQSATSVALENEFLTTFGLRELVDLAEESEADGVAAPYQVIDRRQVEVMKDAGLAVQIWTLNDEALLAHYGRWPVDGLITDYPEWAP